MKNFTRKELQALDLEEKNKRMEASLSTHEATDFHVQGKMINTRIKNGQHTNNFWNLSPGWVEGKEGNKLGRLMQICLTNRISAPGRLNSQDIARHVLIHVPKAICLVVEAKGEPHELK